MRSINKGLLKVGFSIIVLLLFSRCSESDPSPAAGPTQGLLLQYESYALGSGAKFQFLTRKEIVPGFNKVYFFLTDSITGKPVTNADINLTPVMDMGMKTHSCPFENPVLTSIPGLYEGAIVFTMPSGDMGEWRVELTVEDKDTDRFGDVVFDVDVKSVTPSAIYSFTTEASGKFFVAIDIPNMPKVGVNDIDVVVYRSSEDNFIPVEDLSIAMEPEMPSMDHGSPNNQNPVYTSKGHYLGKANFTMTGEWRINLDLASEDEEIKSLSFDVIVH